MAQAAAALSDPDKLNSMSDQEIADLLNSFSPDLIAAWVGTPERPGPVTALTIAGYRGGDRVLQGVAKTAAPPAPMKTEFPVMPVDWGLLSVEARDWARAYSYDLITRINQTTVTALRNILSAAVTNGLTRDQIAIQINALFHDKVRSKMIAQTEANRVYTNGAYNRMERAGITQATWQNVRDNEVCPICRPLRNVVGNIRDGWVHPGGPGKSERYRGNVFQIPAHPNCRCFPSPVITLQAENVTTDDVLREFDLRQIISVWHPTVKPDPIAPPKPPAQEVDYKAVLTAHQKEIDKITKALPVPLKEMDWQDSSGWGAKIDAGWATAQEVTKQIIDYRVGKTQEELDNSEEYRRLYKLREDLRNEARIIQEKAAAAFRKAQEKSKANFIKAISAGQKKADIPIDNKTNLKKKNADDALKWLQTTINGEKVYTANTLKVLPIRDKTYLGGRSYFSGRDMSINMEPNAGTDVWVHEIGHYIEESNPSIHQACIDFVLKRATSMTEVPMNKLVSFGGYEANEKAYPDHFYHPYVGKVYPTNSEVLSMGLQALFTDPADFYKRDPEHFALTVAALKGWYND